MKVLLVVLLLIIPFVMSVPLRPSHPLAIAAQDTKLSCDECTTATDVARLMVFKNSSEDDVIKFVVDFCIHFKIENNSVCEGIVNMFKDEFWFILQSELSSTDICGWFFEVCPFPNTTHYNVTFPKPKPPHVAPTPPAPGDPTQIILHISDMHFDPQYQEGMNNDCGEPLCCRPSNGYGKGNSSAGKWGDYQCDLNLLMLTNLKEYWQTMDPKPDYVFWTGDNPPHDVWMQTREGQINNSAYLAQVIKEAFGNIPVFPAIGNHESVPVNSFPLPPLNAWLLDALADQWSGWLTQDAMQTFQYGGYYEMEMKPGFRVVSLNMNYCNDGNGWLLLNNSDPAGMLQWLINVLQTSEDNQERVYIIGHIPPGAHVCLPTWGGQFYEITNRYEDTIIAQFYGHTHSDQFQLFYENDPDSGARRATNVAYIVPSVTTYQNYNPSYRLYTIDNSTGYIVESGTYHANLTAANLYDSPKWVLEYNASAAYALPTLFAPDWDNLVSRMASTENKLLQLYYWYESSSAGPQEYCDDWCAKGIICSLRSATSDLLHKCQADQGMDLVEANKHTSC